MRKLVVIAIACFFVVSGLFVLGKGLFFYQGRYQPPYTALPNLEEITVPALAPVVFSEQPEQRAGTVLIDGAHDNNFSPWELNTLVSRVASRGSTVEFLKARAESTRADEESRTRDLQEKLRFVESLVIISPQSPFSGKEIQLIKEFVGKGGKLLLIEDPTRKPKRYAYERTESIPINDISVEFGFIFEDAYLYNMKENNGNYRYVYFREFAESELTKGLGTILLYSAGSFGGSGMGIVFADQNTFSSNIEVKGGLSPLVLTTDAGVLGIYDLTFLIEPYNASFDNNQLISNTADWLTLSTRVLPLSDFPHFLEKAPLVAYADVSLLRKGIEFKNALVEMGKTPSVAEYEEAPSISMDTVFIGLFKQSEKIKRFLDRGNISLTETSVEVKGIGSIPQEGLSVIYLYQDNDTDLLVVLAETDEKLQETLELLKGGEFRRWLVTDMLAIFPPEKLKEEEKEPEQVPDTARPEEGTTP